MKFLLHEMCTLLVKKAGLTIKKWITVDPNILIHVPRSPSNY